jgi:hypothetical protein
MSDPMDHGGTPASGRTDVAARPRRRGWLEVRWRQLRNAPTPVWRAVVADATVAALGGALLLAYDVALDRGARLPGGDLRTAAAAVFVLLVVGVGSLATYLWVPLPAGSGARRRRTAWSGMLGLFASLPIAYLALVLLFQVIRPFLG